MSLILPKHLYSVTVIREMNARCWLRLGSSTFWATEDGKSSGWQEWYSIELPPWNLLQPWPSFTKTHSWLFISAFLYCYDHHSMLITNLTNRTLWDKILLFDFVLLCCFTSIRNSAYMVLLYSMFPVPVLNCLYMVPSRFCNCYLMQFYLSLPCDTSSFSLLLLEHIG